MTSIDGELDPELRSGMLKTATEDLERVVLVVPSNWRALMHLGTVKALQGDYADAAEEYDRALKLVANEPPLVQFEVLFNKCSALITAEDTDAAIEVLGQCETALGALDDAPSYAHKSLEALRQRLSQNGLG